MIHIGKHQNTISKTKQSTYVKVAPSLLKWLGGGTLLGILSIVVAYYTYPAEIVVDSTVNPSDTYSSSSRIKIKNIGIFPASNIRGKFVLEDSYMDRPGMKNIRISNARNTNTINLASKLSHGEETEIPIHVGVEVSQNLFFDKYCYRLHLSYESHFLMFTRTVSKEWEITLSKRPDGYSWLIKNI